MVGTEGVVNSKSQMTNHKQSPNSNPKTSNKEVAIGGVWSLEFDG
jgi:hypothetical protein